MPEFKLSNEEVAQCNGADAPAYPKYTTQLINLANQNAGATRPKQVGQLSELLPKYLASDDRPSLDGWADWYTEQYPDAVENAAKKIWKQVKNLREALELIDKDMVRTWVEDLIYHKTFNGLYYQEAILQKIAEMEDEPYRLATPAEEAMNIDGYVGGVPYQIKPDTYDAKQHEVHEEIPCRIVRYEKTKNGIKVKY